MAAAGRAAARVGERPRARATPCWPSTGGPSFPSDRPLFHGRLRPTALVRVDGDAWVEEPLASLAGREVVALAGIARPERLAGGARARRALWCATRCTSPTIMPTARTTSRRSSGRPRAATVVTTEKDLAKLGGVPGLEGAARAARDASRSRTRRGARRSAGGRAAASGFARGV